MGKLTVANVRNAKPGRYSDGDGLTLLVKPSGARSWVLRVQVLGKRRDIGLGSGSALSLADVREEAAKLRRLAKRGLDPVAERDKEIKVIPDFAKAAKDAFAALGKGWADKTAKAFLPSLEAHAFPALGRKRVDAIDAGTVRDALAPIWLEKPEQARKVMVRIGQVLDFAHLKGWRAEGAPISKAIKQGLANQPKGRAFASMPYADVPGFVERLKGETQTVGRLALLFTILTAARSGEVRKARWGQLDMERGLWVRSADMMKEGEAHSVMLSKAALDVLESVRPLANATGLIFPGTGNRGLSAMTLTKALRACGETVTVHGFRSSFRSWSAEAMPHIPWNVAEMCLAHSVGSKVEKAYLRADLVAMRRQLMDAWAAHCCGEKGNVVRLVA